MNFLMRREDLLQKWNYCLRDLKPKDFLEDMYESYKLLHNPNSIRAVGFKSFPEHYWDYGHPNVDLESTFRSMMVDSSIKKVILRRENSVAVYISMNRSKLTGDYLTRNYDNVKISINIPDMQKFLDRYDHTYKMYNEMTLDQLKKYIKSTF